jgi:hypothetical protein
MVAFIAILIVLYFTSKTYFWGLLLIGGFLTIKLLWEFIFCRAKNTKDGLEFNLPVYAEISQFILLLGLACISIYSLISYSPPWYAWILPMIYTLMLFFKGLDILSNRKDKLIMNGNRLIWHNDQIKQDYKIVSYYFKNGKSKAMQLSLYNDTGWQLFIVDEEGGLHKLDLMTMNLNGFKSAIGKEFNKAGIKEIE